MSQREGTGIDPFPSGGLLMMLREAFLLNPWLDLGDVASKWSQPGGLSALSSRLTAARIKMQSMLVWPQFFHNFFPFCLRVSSVDWIHYIFGHQPPPINATHCLCTRFCANVTDTHPARCFPTVFRRVSGVRQIRWLVPLVLFLVLFLLPPEQAAVWGHGEKEPSLWGGASVSCFYLCSQGSVRAMLGRAVRPSYHRRHLTGAESPGALSPAAFFSSSSPPISLLCCSSRSTSRSLFHHSYSAVLLLFFLSASLKFSPHLFNSTSWVKCCKAVISC